MFEFLRLIHPTRVLNRQIYSNRDGHPVHQRSVQIDWAICIEQHLQYSLFVSAKARNSQLNQSIFEIPSLFGVSYHKIAFATLLPFTRIINDAKQWKMPCLRTQLQLRWFFVIMNRPIAVRTFQCLHNFFRCTINVTATIDITEIYLGKNAK